MNSISWSLVPGRRRRPAELRYLEVLPRVSASKTVASGTPIPGMEVINRPGFDGGSDNTEGSLPWDRRGTPMSCESGPRGRALDALADPARAKGAIRRIAEELGVHPEALRTWVKKAQLDGGLRSGTTTDQAQRIKELVKEVREL